MGAAGLVADVKQAFSNIEIDDRDQGYLRFLLFNEVFSEDQKIVVYFFLRVKFGITSSLFLLWGTIKCDFSNIDVVANINVDVILNFLLNLYVDYVTIFIVVTVVQLLFVNGNVHVERFEKCFNLRKWESNDKKLREQSRKHKEYVVDTSCRGGRDSGVVDNIGSSDKIGGVEAVNSIFRKVLHVTWDPKRDDFVFLF